MTFVRIFLSVVFNNNNQQKIEIPFLHSEKICSVQLELMVIETITKVYPIHLNCEEDEQGYLFVSAKEHVKSFTYFYIDCK